VLGGRDATQPNSSRITARHQGGQRGEIGEFRNVRPLEEGGLGTEFNEKALALRKKKKTLGTSINKGGPSDTH